MTIRASGRRRLAIIGVGLTVACFVALNTFGSLSLRSVRLDLTENRQFTLSPGTERMLGRIDEPVTLRLYVSGAVRETNPPLAAYADRVHDMLEAYAEASRGMVSVAYVDPEPYSLEEDRAEGFGLEPIPLDAVGTSGYFGIAGTNSTDDVDVLPALSPERETFLEYDLTRLVYNLSHPEKPIVAVLSSLPVEADPALRYQPWQAVKELEQFFQIRHVQAEAPSLEGVDMLMLIHPQDLPEGARYAVDQFVLGGGEALVFVDPHSEAQAVRERQPSGVTDGTASDLPDLLRAWGVGFTPGEVVADPDAARQVTFPSGGRDQVVDYLPWLSIDDRLLDERQVVTAELDQLNLASAGALRQLPDAPTTFAPLLRSSPAAATIDADKVRVYPDPFAILRDFRPDDDRHVLAAQVTGPAASAFPGKPADVPSGAEHLARASDGINVVVVADTDLLEDGAWLAKQDAYGEQMHVPVADNAGFVANALDYLAGSDALLDTRGREVTHRPFTRVAEIRRDAEARYRAKEQDLLRRLEELQQKLSTAQVGDGEDDALLSERQREEIEGFRRQMAETRDELRAVQLALREDIESLQARIRFFGIAAVPIVLALLAGIVALINRARYRRRLDAAAA